MPIDRSIVTKEDIARGYDAIAEKVFVSDDFYREVLGIEKNFSGDILEVGVGQGVVLKYIRERGRNIRSLTGLDLSDRLIEMARKNVPSAHIVKGDAEDMPFSNASFDIVVMVDVFQYLIDVDKALSEVHRVLRKGGSFIVTVPNRDWILFKRYIKNRKNIQPVEDRFFNFNEMAELLSSYGFSIASYRGADAFRFYAPYHRYESWLSVVIPWMRKRMKKITFKAVT
ncbi:MAG: class I SAM-dependent methyltransferase [Patescibacteria group bacterium]